MQSFHNSCKVASVAPDLVVWGLDYNKEENLELDLKLDIHNFCSEVK